MKALVLQISDQAPKHFKLSSSLKISIGRAHDNSFVVTDISVSRHHAYISVLSAGTEGFKNIEVKDLNSSNGSSFGSKKIKSKPILINSDSDDNLNKPFELKVGRVVITLTIKSQSWDEETSTIFQPDFVKRELPDNNAQLLPTMISEPGYNKNSAGLKFIFGALLLSILLVAAAVAYYFNYRKLPSSAPSPNLQPAKIIKKTENSDLIQKIKKLKDVEARFKVADSLAENKLYAKALVGLPEITMFEQLGNVEQIQRLKDNLKKRQKDWTQELKKQKTRSKPALKPRAAKTKKVNAKSQLTPEPTLKPNSEDLENLDLKQEFRAIIGLFRENNNLQACDKLKYITDNSQDTRNLWFRKMRSIFARKCQ